MTTKDVLSVFRIEDIRDLPEAVMRILEGDLTDRNAIFFQLLELNKYDMSYDWFQSVYEAEMSQRKDMKQEFTPNSVSRIASMITGNPKGSIHEPTAGNGSMIITDWWQRCLNSDFPLMHFPADNMVNCWELSARSIPLLLFNLSIRGIMGYVYHGDVLERTIKCRYILLNKENDTLSFSDIIKDTNVNLLITEI